MLGGGGGVGVGGGGVLVCITVCDAADLNKVSACLLSRISSLVFLVAVLSLLSLMKAR